MKLIVYCAKKECELRKTKGRIATFDDVIKEIEAGDFYVAYKANDPHKNQPRFIVIVDDYPIVVPYNENAETIRLITLFPDRRYRDEEEKK